MAMTSPSPPPISVSPAKNERKGYWHTWSSTSDNPSSPALIREYSAVTLATSSSRRLMSSCFFSSRACFNCFSNEPLRPATELRSAYSSTYVSRSSDDSSFWLCRYDSGLATIIWLPWKEASVSCPLPTIFTSPVLLGPYKSVSPARSAYVPPVPPLTL